MKDLLHITNQCQDIICLLLSTQLQLCASLSCVQWQRESTQEYNSLYLGTILTCLIEKKILGSVINLPEKKTSLEAANLGDLAAHKTQEPTKTLRIWAKESDKWDHYYRDSGIKALVSSHRIGERESRTRVLPWNKNALLALCSPGTCVTPMVVFMRSSSVMISICKSGSIPNPTAGMRETELDQFLLQIR